jgi:HAMP domain-containing protein
VASLKTRAGEPMSLLLRINVALVAAFAVAAALIALVCHSVLEAGAERQMLAEAGLMMDSALAARAYTASEIEPLLRAQMEHEFLPQSVPFYAATEHFLRLQAARPDYSYREATLNPTNPRDRALDWQADLIQRFRDNAAAQELVGERETPMGRALYLARPIHARPECLSCHGTATSAPATILTRYGANNGFGWQENEVVGAQVVSVPIDTAQAKARGSFRVILGSLIGAFVVLLLLVNLLLYRIVVRPVRRMAQIAERVSAGDGSAAEFAVGGAPEIAALGRSFNRMRVSLNKALKLLESRP